MDQEKVGKLIKEIRIQNKMTQKEFAQKYNVTYQAVSKWENGKNIPDFAILKQISKDYHVSLDDISEGEYAKRKKIEFKYVIPIVLIVLCLFIILFLALNRNHDFQFNTISSNCSEFTISGSLAYSDSKSAIYITNINYCGESDHTKYDRIECTLYEIEKDQQLKISTFNYEDNEPVTLDKFLENVTFSIDNYNRVCKNYSNNSLVLDIKAHDGNKTINYTIPLSIDDSCHT